MLLVSIILWLRTRCSRLFERGERVYQVALWSGRYKRRCLPAVNFPHPVRRTDHQTDWVHIDISRHAHYSLRQKNDGKLLYKRSKESPRNHYLATPTYPPLALTLLSFKAESVPFRLVSTRTVPSWPPKGTTWSTSLSWTPNVPKSSGRLKGSERKKRMRSKNRPPSNRRFSLD